MIQDHKRMLGRELMFIVIIIAIVAVSLVASGCSRSSQKQKVYHVGILSGLEYVAEITDGVKAGMAELGYVEGKDVSYDVQRTDFDIAAYKRIIDKFVAEKVDVIVVFPTEATMEAKTATQGTGIPVVFTFALIEGMNIVDSIREPGGDITGVRYPGPDIALRRFEIMHELVPEARRYLIPYQRGYPIVTPQLQLLRQTAEASGITLIELPADNAAEVQEYFSLRNESDPGFDAIMLIVEPLGVNPNCFEVLGKFAYEHKMPFGGAYMKMGNYTTIYGVNVNLFATGKQTAPLIDKIFKGKKAGTIPVVSAESFLQIDYDATQNLGINVSEGLLAMANEIIR